MHPASSESAGPACTRSRASTASCPAPASAAGQRSRSPCRHNGRWPILRGCQQYAAPLPPRPDFTGCHSRGHPGTVTVRLSRGRRQAWAGGA
eukprot:14238909-Alexandrium_andersonii.AAC.1